MTKAGYFIIMNIMKQFILYFNEKKNILVFGREKPLKTQTGKGKW